MGEQEQIQDKEGAMPTARAASLRPQPATRSSQSGIAIAELATRDVAAIRDHAARVLFRMNQTPHGPKRRLLAAQHVDLTNEALRAEGWNEAIAKSKGAA